MGKDRVPVCFVIVYHAYVGTCMGDYRKKMLDRTLHWDACTHTWGYISGLHPRSEAVLPGWLLAWRKVWLAVTAAAQLSV